ncbi:MAG: uridine kinase [Jatrophihabitantaceae bacterium]
MSASRPAAGRSGAFTPLSPDRLADRLAAVLVRHRPGDRPLRVGLDVPGCADLETVIDGLTDRLRTAGRPVARVRAEGFYRDASLRFEYGRTDLESFYAGWLDRAALHREVLRPLVEQHRYLPSLRDPVSNRSTRAEPVELPAAAVVLITGELLLAEPMAFDLTVHVMVSRQARRRLSPADQEWTLPAFDRYDLAADPAGTADLVIRFDDPAHPALLERNPS